jgi:hypothetical protein
MIPMAGDWSAIRHFVPEEWGEWRKLDWGLVVLLDQIREEAGCQIVIHEAWAASGHSPKSYHYTGQAVDFSFRGLSGPEQYCLLSGFRRIGGIGYYPRWIHPGWHVDLRNGLGRLQWVHSEAGYRYGYRAMAKALGMA